MRYLRIISVLLAIGGSLAVLVGLVVANLVPSGVFVAHWRPGEPSRFIGPVVPESRLLPLGISTDGTIYQSLVDEPVNFDVRLPSTFDTATVKITMSGDPKIVEIGGLASRETWTNDLRPAVNGILKSLNWHTIREDGLTLYQRLPNFKTIDGFLKNMPNAGVAVYRADAGSMIKIPNYTPSPVVKKYTTAFRGAASIKIYLENEPLDIKFRAQEVNRHVNPDGFVATASLAGAKIARAVYADDGNDSADGRPSGLSDLRLFTKEKITGIVRIDLPAGDDVVFRETVTTAQKFVFVNRFYAADNVGYLKDPAAFTLVTNGRRLYATTAHPEAFQKLLVGSSSLVIDDLNKPFNVSTAQDVRQFGNVAITSPYGDIRLETAGLFSFDKNSFFNPDPQSVTWETDVEKDGIDYILTSYAPGATDGVWQTAKATFDINKLSVVKRTINFTVSVPGLALQQKELRISAIDVELRRAPLSAKDIVPNLKKMWRLITGQEKEIVNGLKN